MCLNYASPSTEITFRARRWKSVNITDEYISHMKRLEKEEMANLRELIFNELDKMEQAKERGQLKIANIHAKYADKMIDMLVAGHYDGRKALDILQ